MPVLNQLIKGYILLRAGGGYVSCSCVGRNEKMKLWDVAIYYATPAGESFQKLHTCAYTCIHVHRPCIHTLKGRNLRNLYSDASKRNKWAP